MSGIDLADALLFEAQLSGANLSGADLASVELVAVDLSNADLSGANLTGLRWAGTGQGQYYSADLTGVVTDATTLCPDGAPGPCNFAF